MKKLIALLLSVMLTVSCLSLVACKDKGNNKEDEKENPYANGISVYAPDGAPALSIAKFINDDEDFGTDIKFSYNVVSSDKIGPTMAQGKGDIIIMPVNAASKLYSANKNDKYKMVSVVTHGNLYLMSDSEITLEDLKGTTVGVIGQGLVPDLTFKAVLEANNISYNVDGEASGDDVALKYYNEGRDLISALNQGILSVGLLPEPAATTLTKVANNKTWYRLDLQELYDSEAKSYPQAVMMVKESLINQMPEVVEDIETAFTDNVTWVKNNTADAVAAVNSRLAEGVTPSLVAANITSTVVDNCKISWQSSKDAKDAIKAYISDIIAIAANSAIAPADEFFY